mmetsp:Transcript_22849/g.26044  ORF Transcript_22849/g.26044 Transcript_22849/m.26044 type:complete len:94 (+) Transcript_22849:857-1138(+)
MTLLMIIHPHGKPRRQRHKQRDWIGCSEKNRGKKEMNNLINQKLSLYSRKRNSNFLVILQFYLFYGFLLCYCVQFATLHAISALEFRSCNDEE